MKTRISCITVVVLSLTSISAFARSTTVGNGGGFWVCRNSSHLITKSYSYDLWKAQNVGVTRQTDPKQEPLSIERHSQTSAREQADQIATKIRRYNSIYFDRHLGVLYNKIKEEIFSKLESTKQEYDRIDNNDAKALFEFFGPRLELVNDFNARKQPPFSLCPEVDNKLEFETAGIYYDKKIVLQPWAQTKPGYDRILRQPMYPLIVENSFSDLGGGAMGNPMGYFRFLNPRLVKGIQNRKSPADAIPNEGITYGDSLEIDPYIILSADTNTDVAAFIWHEVINRHLRLVSDNTENSNLASDIVGVVFSNIDISDVTVVSGAGGLLVKVFSEELMDKISVDIFDVGYDETTPLQSYIFSDILLRDVRLGGDNEHFRKFISKDYFHKGQRVKFAFENVSYSISVNGTQVRENALTGAIRAYDFELVRFLVEQLHFDVNVRLKNNVSPLELARSLYSGSMENRNNVAESLDYNCKNRSYFEYSFAKYAVQTEDRLLMSGMERCDYLVISFLQRYKNDIVKTLENNDAL